jgi:Tfp pilus assembly protein PilF
MARSDASALSALAVDGDCQKAMDLQIAGQLDLAEQMYRAILQTEPKHATANHCIGMLHVQLQRPTEGLSYLLAALETSPAVPDYWLGYLARRPMTLKDGCY